MDDHYNNLNEALRLAGARVGADLALDANASCEFIFRDEVPLLVKRITPYRYIVASVVLENVDHTPELLEIISRFNWLGGPSDGACLVWNPDAKALVLWTAHGLDRVNEERITTHIESLIATTFTLKEQCRAALEEAPAHDETAQESFTPTGFFNRA